MRCILTHWVLLTYICRNELGWSLVYTSPTRCQSLPVFRGSNEKKWMHISCFRKTGKTYSIQNCAFIWYVPLVGSFDIVTENMWKCSFCEQISQTLLLWYELRAQQQLFFKATSQYITMTSPTMMTSSNENIFRVAGPFVRGIHRPPADSPHKSQWRGASVFSLICTWANGWTNNRDAGDLRSHRNHYNVTVMANCIVYLSVYSGEQHRNKKFPITDFCDGNLSVNGFPLQKASNAESGPK